MSEHDRTYNAAVDMVDRHLEEGRGGKVAFIDENGPCTYEELAHQCNRVATGVSF